MEENMIEETVSKEQEEKMAELSEKRIEIIQKQIKSYFTALSPLGKLSPEEMLLIGMDTITAGYGLISRFSDMAEQNVEDRINAIMSVRAGIDGILSKTLLNKPVVEAMVANTAMHNIKASKNKLIK